MATAHDGRTWVDACRRAAQEFINNPVKKISTSLPTNFYPGHVCDENNRLAKPFPFEVLFSDKKAMSSGLQLADLVARPIGLSVMRPEQDNRAFEVLKRKFYCDGGREHVGSGYNGMGMKIHPPPESEKPR